jgi:hypothetical protein
VVGLSSKVCNNRVFCFGTHKEVKYLCNYVLTMMLAVVKAFVFNLALPFIVMFS